MARFAIIYALLMFLLAFAEALRKVYQTIITTTEFDEQDPSQSEKCRSQLSRMSMNSCKYYMLLPGSFLEQGCCKELERVNDPECRCEALRQRVQGYGQEQLQEAAMKVEGLADTCEMQELRSCQIRGQQEF
ncbi:hypothetical protein FRX31_034062 [Thalictrum thalictroides]|uniref:Bifunctional inhibitor/plant lipid transfer protein/seed storage helical domain-containing protein n=1 Tax=Thalictrum thalictroides TaxID=46969 RepID=A0A7J6UV66_THATH|nr:hypothetical protein FRX31_034062 [Thalictrum thalictroides]